MKHDSLRVHPLNAWQGEHGRHGQSSPSTHVHAVHAVWNMHLCLSHSYTGVHAAQRRTSPCATQACEGYLTGAGSQRSQAVAACVKEG